MIIGKRAQNKTVNVRALSGYAESKHQGMVAFSLLVNNFEAPEKEAADFIDRIGLKLLF